MVEILCFDFEWQYIKSEFSADHKHAEFGTRDFKGKNLQRNLQLIFLKGVPMVSGNSQKVFSVEKMDFFFTFKSHKKACESGHVNSRAKTLE